MKDSELSLRIRDLIKLKKKRVLKRDKKIRWAKYSYKSVPIVSTGGPNLDWLQRLREKLKYPEL